MEMMWPSMMALLFAALILLVRAFIDARRKQWFWAAISFAGALAILCAPIQTHAVKIDLPRSNG
ncbi:hypothetical protein ASE85_07335 [Sphingobium sp. Leaf26]|nr:hypothetical protein ASE85_07335 [Sphingobium sp. Leaf26]